MRFKVVENFIIEDRDSYNKGDIALYKLNKDDIGVYPGYNGSLDLGISLSKVEKKGVSKYCLIRTYIDRELYTGEGKEEGRIICINPINENIIYVPREYNKNSEMINDIKERYDSVQIFLQDLKEAYIKYLQNHEEEFNRSHNIKLDEFLKLVEDNNLQKPLISSFSQFQRMKLTRLAKEKGIDISFTGK